MVVYRILFDSGVILGPVYINFGVRELQNVVFSGLVSRSFVYRFLNRNVDVWDFKIVVFASGIAKNDFHGNGF